MLPQRLLVVFALLTVGCSGYWEDHPCSAAGACTSPVLAGLGYTGSTWTQHSHKRHLLETSSLQSACSSTKAISEQSVDRFAALLFSGDVELDSISFTGSCKSLALASISEPNVLAATLDTAVVLSNGAASSALASSDAQWTTLGKASLELNITVPKTTPSDSQLVLQYALQSKSFCNQTAEANTVNIWVGPADAHDTNSNNVAYLPGFYDVSTSSLDTVKNSDLFASNITTKVRNLLHAVRVAARCCSLCCQKAFLQCSREHCTSSVVRTCNVPVHSAVISHTPGTSTPHCYCI